MSDGAGVFNAPMRVLVLDDEPLILMDLQFTLEDAGLEPVTASSLDRALELIEAQTLDAAVLDVNLGRGQTCQPVAERLKELGIPFILHTGDLERRGEMVTKFEVPIVNKPSSAESVVDAVKNL